MVWWEWALIVLGALIAFWIVIKLIGGTIAIFARLLLILIFLILLSALIIFIADKYFDMIWWDIIVDWWQGIF